jgi:hypothetical protein
LPGGEDFRGERGEVADVDATLVEVEAERFGSAVAEGEGCEAFGGVGEPVQLGEPGCSVGVGDVAEDAAGADLAIAAAGTGKSTAMQTLAAAFRTACGPPSTSPACASQAAFCSVRVRGSCLVSRVSRVAC